MALPVRLRSSAALAAVPAQFATPAGRGQAVPEVLRGADPQSEHPQGVLPGGVAVCRLV